MLLGTLSQAQSFLAAVYGGALLCACWDIARALRTALGAGRLVTLLSDAAFSLCAFAVILFVLLAATGGEMRVYLLLGLALGAVLFETAAGRITRKLFEKVFGALSRKILQIVRHPFIRKLFR